MVAKSLSCKSEREREKETERERLRQTGERDWERYRQHLAI
jgi:hypothetical protein